VITVIEGLLACSFLTAEHGSVVIWVLDAGADILLRVAIVKRGRKALPKALQLSIFVRDGWLCCWCRKPVIFAPAMRLLEIETEAIGNGPVAYYHAHWTRNGSPLLDELGAVIDHIEAFSAGGPDDEDNLCTSCCKCNGRKSSAALSSWTEREQRRAIKGKYGEPQHWDGFSSIFILLASRNPQALSATEQSWLKVMQAWRAHNVLAVESNP
jgi:5-methylcytosine-specific restriction endonuclease McrA